MNFALFTEPAYKELKVFTASIVDKITGKELKMDPSELRKWGLLLNIYYWIKLFFFRIR